MRLAPSLFAAAFALMLIAPATALQAQEAEEPEPVTHYVSVTTFHVPYNAETQEKVNWWIDSVLVPSTNMNPYVLSSRVGNHIYGSKGGDVVFITEYADWNAINADCEPCDTWFESRQPAEGTPEREAWDKAQAAFLKYFTGHHDEIYAMNMDRSK